MQKFNLDKVKKTVCIFAHPDDESFGPSGTIAKLCESGQVYVICVTDGGAGEKTHLKDDLKRIREKELIMASKILGVKKVFFLNYKDGELKNNIYHKVTKDIEKIVRSIKPDTLLTFELRGVSGHIDHVFCAMVTSFIFQRDKLIKNLLYFCNPEWESKLIKNYFIYFPKGYKESEVDLVVDVKKYVQKKVSAIKSHKSQIKDAIMILGILKLFPKKEYFLVSRK